MTDSMVRLLTALGYDPAAVWGRSVMGRTMPGVLVTHRDGNGRDSGKAIRFYTRKQLRRLGRDGGFLAEWDAAETEQAT